MIFVLCGFRRDHAAARGSEGLIEVDKRVVLIVPCYIWFYKDCGSLNQTLGIPKLDFPNTFDTYLLKQPSHAAPIWEWKGMADLR